MNWWFSWASNGTEKCLEVEAKSKTRNPIWWHFNYFHDHSDLLYLGWTRRSIRIPQMWVLISRCPAARRQSANLSSQLPLTKQSLRTCWMLSVHRLNFLTPFRPLSHWRPDPHRISRTDVIFTDSWWQSLEIAPRYELSGFGWTNRSSSDENW